MVQVNNIVDSGEMIWTFFRILGLMVFTALVFLLTPKPGNFNSSVILSAENQITIEKEAD